MVVAQGDVCWADLGEPRGSAPGYSRPVVVVQGDTFNRSDIATVVVVPLTTNLRLSELPGNVLLPARATRLPKDSVANVSQIQTVDRRDLDAAIGRLSRARLWRILAGIDIVLGR